MINKDGENSARGAEANREQSVSNLLSTTTERLFALEVENYLASAAEPGGPGEVFAYWLRLRKARRA